MLYQPAIDLSPHERYEVYLIVKAMLERNFHQNQRIERMMKFQYPTSEVLAALDTLHELAVETRAFIKWAAMRHKIDIWK
jgi:hypothetical protein